MWGTEEQHNSVPTAAAELLSILSCACNAGAEFVERCRVLVAWVGPLPRCDAAWHAEIECE